MDTDKKVPKFELDTNGRLRPIHQIRMLRNAQGESYPDRATIPVLMSRFDMSLRADAERRGFTFLNSPPIIPLG